MTFLNSARRGAPLALIAASSLVLVGCAGGSGDEKKSETSANAADCTEYTSGSASDDVTVAGDLGAEALTAEFTAPVEAKKIERTIVTPGDGDVTAVGDTVNVQITIFNGTSGESTFSQPAAMPVGDDTVLEAFLAGFECVPVGSRVVTVVPSADLFGGEGNEQLGLAAGDSAVIVTDVIDTVAPVTPVEWTENPADVVFNGEEPPTLTLPGAEPPAELLLAVLEEGDGAVVGDGDSVTINYQGTSWNTGEIFDQSYGKEPATFATTGVIPGFGAAMVGQKVGSKLVVSIPPKDAYGEEGADHELAGQTLVFVIEIIDAKAAGK